MSSEKKSVSPEIGSGQDYAIRVKGLSKKYRLYRKSSHRMLEALHPLGKVYHREFFALRDVSFSVKKGEILGIVGRNGAGKSTLLQILSGVLEPSAGIVDVRGNVTALLELGTGFNPELTGLENIYFHGTIKGKTTAEMDDILDDILGFAEIGDFIHQPLKTYSSGMRARLGFAVAAHMNPQILILDEVLSVGDELFKRKCFAKMEEIFDAGCTVLYVSHSIPSVTHICSRAILVDGGKVILDGIPKMVTSYFFKLLFTPDKEIQQIRNEIDALDRDPERKASFDVESVEEPQKEESHGRINPEAMTRKDTGLEAFFVPGFSPKSTVRISNGDVEIDNLRVTTLKGQAVNMLVPHEEYCFRFTVQFNQDIDYINIGMGITSEKGVLLSAMQHPGKARVLHEKVRKGERINVCWNFRCDFVQGNYYLSCGVKTIVNGELKQLGKVSDALVFKVQAVPGIRKGGFLDAISGVTLTRESK